MRGEQNLDADAYVGAGQARWDDLRIFLIAAEEGSFRGAAERLGCSLNTIRNRVDSLEAALGTVLLTRTVEGVGLTDEGAQFLEHARQVREIINTAGHVLRVRRQGLSGQVRISVTEGLGTFWLIPRMVEFQEQHPAVTLDLHCDMRRLDASKFETDLAVQLSQPERPDLIQVKLGWLHLMPFASERYLRVRGMPSSVDEIFNHRIVEQQADQVDSHILSQITGGARPPSGLVSIRTNTSSAHYWAIAKGAGIGVLPTYARAISKKVRPLDVGLRLKREIWLTYHPDAKRSKAINAAIQWLKRSFDPGNFPWFSENFIHPNEMDKYINHHSVVNLFEGFMENLSLEADADPLPKHARAASAGK